MNIEFLNTWKKFNGITFFSFGIYKWHINRKNCIWGTFIILNIGIKFRIEL